MRIKLDRIPPAGVVVNDTIGAAELDLGPEMTLETPIAAEAQVHRITNAVHVELELTGAVVLSCTRCLNDIRKRLEKHLTLDYVVEPRQREIDLDPEIREELIMDIQLKNLCRPDCKGLCVRCGANLNEGNCACTRTS